MKPVHGLDSVREYYGSVLKTNKDLRTSACCPIDSLPAALKRAVAEIHPEVLERFYGCGSPIPPALEGKTVLDLGSGSGRDCFILAKMVGEKGRVIGVDMTDEQIRVAEKHVPYHMEKYGFKTSNVQFVRGYIEDLQSIGIKDNSVDAVISNCVINLSPRKDLVFSEIFRVLKPGGELYFSDVFANRRIPQALTQHETFVGECLGGAMYKEDFRRMMHQLGCPDFRIMANAKISVNDEEMLRLAGMIEFSSMTVRAFKLNLEDRCEDYGQMATYRGTILEAPAFFALDDHHTFEVGRPVSVCGNTAAMLTGTRFSSHFLVSGNTENHFGLFNCEPSQARESSSAANSPCC